jgi:Ca-activated chloride channel family protein
VSEKDLNQDYYTILGVSPTATPRQIKRAYRALARCYHPDTRTGNAPTTLFHEIQVAYAVLSDPHRRQAYDRRRASDVARSPAAGADAPHTPETPISCQILTSRSQLPSLAHEQALYALIEIKPGVDVEGKRLPLNLCLVIDRSTSMREGRLDHVKEAAHQIIDGLHDEDTLAVVTFSDRAEVILPSQPALNRAYAKAKISSMSASGGTEILQGLQAGLAEIDTHHADHVLSHLVLLTDGQTYGDEDQCIREAQRAGRRRIGITAMGIGEDWNDALLDQIASQSGGTSAYIASSSQVHQLLLDQVRGLGSLFAQGLTLTLHPAEGVHVETLFRTSPYVERLALTDGAASLGTLQSDVPLAVVAELSVNQKSPGKHTLLQFEIAGDIPALGLRGAHVQGDVTSTFTSAEPPPEPVPATLRSALAKATIYQMQQRAWAALDSGDFDTAARRLEMIASRLFDLGETQLARAAMLEAGRIAQGATASAKGRKQLKYGTRSLTIASRRESHD